MAKNKKGILVEAVQPGSVADQVGLEPGDIIAKVNRTPIDSPATYKKQIESQTRIYLEVVRGGRTLFYQFVLPKQ
jgi:S1-C subfamily serine protease